MIIKNNAELDALKESGKLCAYIRDKVADYVVPGMSTLEADEYAGSLFKETGFISAPRQIYNFPGNTCISVNACVAHGIPSSKIILQDGDCVNIDVCGSIGGYFSDCGKSIVVGNNKEKQYICDCAKDMLTEGISTITHKSLLRNMGMHMEILCKSRNLYPVKKLAGHGIGKTLHEKPKHIHCHYMRWDNRRFVKNMVVAIETFVSTVNEEVFIGKDGWSWISPGKAFTAQYEHTIVVTEDKPIIITE